MGRHINTLNSQQRTLGLKFSWMSQSLHLLAICTGKIGAATYLAVLHGPSHTRFNRAFLWTIGTILLLSEIANIIIIFKVCSPVAKLWDESLPGSCNGRRLNEYFAYGSGSRCTSVQSSQLEAANEPVQASLLSRMLPLSYLPWLSSGGYKWPCLERFY